MVPFVQLHGNFATAIDLLEIIKRIAAYGTGLRCKHQIGAGSTFSLLRQRQNGGDALFLVKRKNVDQRLAARLRRSDRQAPHFHAVNHAFRREKQNRRVGVGHKHFGDEIFVPHLHPRPALATATLGTIGGERHTLDVTRMRYGNDHIFGLDQILIINFAIVLDDFSTARCGEIFFDRCQLIRHDGADACAGSQNIEIVFDFGRKFFQLSRDFFEAQLRKALQAQVENGACLLIREAIAAVRIQTMTGISNQLNQRLQLLRGPIATHQGFTRFCCIFRSADKANNFVNIRHRNRKTNQDMGAITGLAQQEFGAACDDFLAERDEVFQQVNQRQLLWSAIGQSDVIDAERALQL